MNKTMTNNRWYINPLALGWVLFLILGATFLHQQEQHMVFQAPVYNADATVEAGSTSAALRDVIIR